MSTYTSKAQQRLMKVIETLSGHERFGLSLTEVAERMGDSTSMIFRDLMNLKETGWARQMGTGNWCLGEAVAEVAVKIKDGFDAAQKELDEKRKAYLGE